MAGKFNDEHLRHQALKLKNPYDQPELIWTVPEGAGLLDILNIYTFERWPKEKVYCVECDGHHHKNGFTALLTSGKRVLLGSTCGARLFGQSWKAAEKRIEDRGNRQYELLKLDRLALIIAPLREGLLGWSDVMERIMARRSAFENKLGDLASRTREAAIRHGGDLTVGRRVENRAARAAGMRDLGDYVEVKVGNVAGAALFMPLDPAKAVARALAAIDEMQQGIGNTDATWTSVLIKRRKAFERTFEDLETAVKMHAGAQDFFTVENFRNLIEWANNHRATKSRYEIDADGIVRDEQRLSGIKISPVADLDDEPLDLIREYRRAD
jgi:hypothetical protein